MADAMKGRGWITAGLAVLTLWYLATPDRYHLLDALDLAVHETGHLVFGWAGEVLAALGGTILQLLIPLAFVVSFWRRGDRHAATVPLWWLGQNCWNIARYVADARSQALPLVGGGEHDWAFLLAEWGRLHQDVTLARDIRFAGTAIALGSLWMGWRALRPGRHSGEIAPADGIEAADRVD